MKLLSHFKSLKNRRAQRAAATVVSLSTALFFFQNCSQIAGFETVSMNTSLASLAASQSKFTCDPSAKPVATPVTRLTKTQFINTLKDTLGLGISSSNQSSWASFFSSANVVNAINSFPSEGMPAKGNSMVFDTADQRISSILLRSQFDLALMAVQWITSDSARLNYFVNRFGGAACPSGSLTNTGVSKACYDAFINGFGLSVLRRPVVAANMATDAGSATPDAGNDLLFYEKIYSDPSQGGFDALMTAMLLSPDSLFLVSAKGDMSASNQVTLTPYELASKFSYYFTDSPPDAQLLAAAADGFTKPGNTITEQVDRLFASPKARARFANFYTQWIRPEAIPGLTATNDSPQTDLAALRANAIQEMVDLTEYYTFGKSGGRLSDIVTSDISFAKTSDLASIYGVRAWSGKKSDGSYDEAALVHFDSSAPRSGLFTRAGYAFSGARDNNLIIRGSRLRKDYLCYDFSPPANFTLAAVATNGPPTVRNLVAANTAGGACAACHTTLINPLGFALENYDSFGRYRKVESIFDSSGKIVQSVPVDSHSIPQVALTDTRSVEDGIGLSQVLGNSVDFNSCFVQHYFRYSQARAENLKADGCAMEEMVNTLANPAGGSIKNMITSVAKASYFKTRQINP